MYHGFWVGGRSSCSDFFVTGIVPNSVLVLFGVLSVLFRTPSERLPLPGRQGVPDGDRGERPGREYPTDGVVPRVSVTSVAPCRNELDVIYRISLSVYSVCNDGRIGLFTLPVRGRTFVCVPSSSVLGLMYEEIKLDFPKKPPFFDRYTLSGCLFCS